MNIIGLDEERRIICVSAKSFPEHIAEAFHTLHQLLPQVEGRTFYGVSYRNSDGGIDYKAGASEAFPGEAEESGAEVFVVQKGAYLSQLLLNWRENENIITKAFQQMLEDPRIHPQGYCLEIYPNSHDVQCLVLLHPQFDTL